MKCPCCGAAELIHDTRDMPYFYKGENATLPAVTGDFCPACGEVILNREHGDRYSELVGQFQRQVNSAYVDPGYITRVRKQLDRAKNPFFLHAEADYFLAERDGEVVGRIAAIHNRLHNEIHGDKVGFFGFFESVNDFRVAAPLLDTAARWVRARDLDTLRGPTSFSTNDECGILVDGFDTPNTIMMPHNPPYYATLLETAGFVKAKDLIALEGNPLLNIEAVRRVAFVMKGGKVYRNR